MPEELDEMVELPEEYNERLQDAFAKVKDGSVELTEAIDYFMEPFMKDLFPSLQSMDETKEAMPAFMQILSGLAGKEIFVKVKGLDEPKTLKATIEMFPRIIAFEKASEEEIEDLPGVEIDVDVMPLLLSGNMDNVFKALSQKGVMKIYKLPTIAGWLDKTIDMADYAPLISVFDEKTTDKIQEQLIPVLDKALKKFDV